NRCHLSVQQTRASPTGIVKAGEYVVRLVNATAAQITAKAGGKLPKEVVSQYQTHYPDEAFIEFSKVFGDAQKVIPWWKR
ncbi:hypothetical protein, partial [Mycobacterium marinum]|uniref:hypothetical protein n=1 Tax=Mycobacterium marinum TaxID=1781 RepID=UPI003568AA5D